MKLYIVDMESILIIGLGVPAVGIAFACIVGCVNAYYTRRQVRMLEYRIEYLEGESAKNKQLSTQTMPPLYGVQKYFPTTYPVPSLDPVQPPQQPQQPQPTAPNNVTVYTTGQPYPRYRVDTIIT